MSAAQNASLNVPGASLYYEIQGSGPVLLMIPGGAADATVFAGVASELSRWYTVVTYDPRGLGRSTLDIPPADQQLVAIMADDARHLLAAMGGEPAFVFANSGGAIIALDLVTRHSHQVRTLIAHEPPAAALLPDGPAILAAMQAAYETYRREGAGPAMREFFAAAGLHEYSGDSRPGGPESQGEPTAETREAMARMQLNLAFFFDHYLRPVAGYQPDIAALVASPTRIVVAVGAASAGQLAYRGGVALAERLGTEVVVFPSDHGGYVTQPEAFAATLHEVLGAG